MEQSDGKFLERNVKKMKKKERSEKIERFHMRLQEAGRCGPRMRNLNVVA